MGLTSVSWVLTHAVWVGVGLRADPRFGWALVRAALGLGGHEQGDVGPQVL